MAAAASPEQPRPVAGVDYPGNLVAFFDWFQSEDDCWRYLVRLRWPDGFRCPACGHGEAWLTARRVFICTACRKRVSALHGTLFARSQLSLLDWFRAAWLMASQKRGVSAASTQTDLGLGSYKTAWALEHNLRRAMMHRDQAKLTGEIEVDETFVGGHRESDKSKGEEGKIKRGRGAPGKTFVAIAVEAPTHYRGLGRVRMRIIPDFHQETLEDFVTDTCARLGHLHRRQRLVQPPVGARLRARRQGHQGQQPARPRRPPRRPPRRLLAEALAARHPPGQRDAPAPGHLSGGVHLPLQPSALPQPRPALLHDPQARAGDAAAGLRHHRLVAPRSARSGREAAWCRAENAGAAGQAASAGSASA